MFRYIVINNFRRGIYNSEVHTIPNGMIEEYGMHCLPDIIVASERKREVTDTPTDMSTREVLADPPSSPDEVESIGIMLRHTRCHRQDVWIEDDVLWGEAHLRKQTIGALRNLDTTLKGGGLSLFIKAHHHHSRSQLQDITGMTEEHLLALLQ